MKKTLLILIVAFTSLTAKAQNVIYLFGMNSQGQPVINTVPMPTVANSGSYTDLLNTSSIQTIPTINSSVTRPINSTTFTVSTTKMSIVFYTVNVSCTATIGSMATGKVSLQYSTNSGSTWIDVSDVSNSNTVSVAVALNSVTAQDMVICGFIPANALVRMVSTSTGTTTLTYIRGQEIY